MFGFLSPSFLVGSHFSFIGEKYIEPTKESESKVVATPQHVLRTQTVLKVAGAKKAAKMTREGITLEVPRNNGSRTEGGKSSLR